MALRNPSRRSRRASRKRESIGDLWSLVEEAIDQPITIVIPQDRQVEGRSILTCSRRGERKQFWHPSVPATW
jgi:hypothetical protein